MVEFAYLYQGLCGLARAHQANTMAGHLGAAVVAGYFFGEEFSDLDDKVYRAVEQELNRIIQGDEALWFDAEKSGITIPELFAPFSDEPAEADRISSIATALAGNIDKVRQSGHNVIFASIAMRALHDHPAYAKPSMIAGIENLIAGFNNAPPGRGYYGEERGWIAGDKVPLDDDTDFPAYKDQQAMVEVVVDELIRSAAVRRRGFGSLFHIINHAAALTELSRFGYGDLARRGLAAHHHHLRLWRSLPNVADELGPLKSAEYDPRTPDYWSGKAPSQWSAHLTHRIKTMYGLFTLLRFIESPAKRKEAEKQFLYLMA